MRRGWVRIWRRREAPAAARGLARRSSLHTQLDWTVPNGGRFDTSALNRANPLDHPPDVPDLPGIHGDMMTPRAAPRISLTAHFLAGRGPIWESLAVLGLNRLLVVLVAGWSLCGHVLG